MRRAIDATALNEYKTCARKYYYTMVLGYRSPRLKPALETGSVIHRALELYHKTVAHKCAEGMTPHDAKQIGMREAVRYVMCVTTYWTVACRHCGSPIYEYTYEEMPRSDDAIYVCGECGSESGNLQIDHNDADWTTQESQRSRFTIVRTVVWYLDQFANDVFETLILPDGRPAVELSFRIALPLQTPDGDSYLYVGHIDRLAKYMHGGNFLADNKHTASTLSTSYFNQYSPDGQITGYTFAGEVMLMDKLDGAVIDAAQIGATFSRFARGFANRTADQVDEWLQSTLRWIKRIEQDAIENKWDMNEQSCHHYGGCVFRDKVCSMTPSSRQSYLDQHFTKRHWNPLTSR